MNHQRFKFYKHSTEYYKSLYNTITELEELDVTPCLQQYPSTINYNRKSKFIMYYYYLSILISLLLFIPQDFINLYSYQQLTISQSYSQSS